MPLSLDSKDKQFFSSWFPRVFTLPNNSHQATLFIASDRTQHEKTSPPNHPQPPPPPTPVSKEKNQSSHIETCELTPVFSPQTRQFQHRNPSNRPTVPTAILPSRCSSAKAFSSMTRLRSRVASGFSSNSSNNPENTRWLPSSMFQIERMVNMIFLLHP